MVSIPEPTRPQVRQMLLDLLAGRRTRKQVADWATGHMLALEDARIQDMTVWESLTRLSGADLLRSLLTSTCTTT
jgi:hypothetical protein